MIYSMAFQDGPLLNGERREERAVRHRLPEGGSAAQIQTRAAEDLLRQIHFHASPTYIIWLDKARYSGRSQVRYAYSSHRLL